MNILLSILVVLLIIAIIYIASIRKEKLRLNNLLNFAETQSQEFSKNVIRLTNENSKLTEIISIKDNTIRNYNTYANSRNEEIINNIVFLTDDNKIAENVKVKTIINDLGVISVFPTIRRKVAGKWKEVPVKISIK